MMRNKSYQNLDLIIQYNFRLSTIKNTETYQT